MNATRQKILAAAAAFVALPALSACGVSFGAQTDQVYTPADGENDRQGQVDVLNALIVSGTDGSGRLIAGLANNDPAEDNELVAVQGAGENQAVTVTIDGTAEIPAGEMIQLADEPMVSVEGDPESIAPGRFVRLTFQLDSGESATLNVPVLAHDGYYSDVELPED